MCWTQPVLIWASSPTPATGAARRNMPTSPPSSPAPSFAMPKTDFGPGLVIDADDYRQCIKAARDAGYAGPFTLIFASDGDEWAGLAAERAFVLAQYS